jgi:hypothetical protein
MKRFGRKQWIAVAALVLVILVTGLFTVRTVRRAVYWRLHRDEVIRPWMSIPYIAHSYRIAPHILYESLGMAAQPRDRRPIREIAREQNRSVDELIATLQNAIARERATHVSGAPPASPVRSP